MYLKHKICFYLICVLIVAQTGFSKTFFESVKDLFSFKVPENIFSSVNDAIVGKLNAKNITFYLPNKIEMDDVELLDEHGARVLYGKHVTLTISLISLLTNNIRITNALIDAPFFHYTIINDVHNIISPFNEPPHIVQKPESNSKIKVTIENVNVVNGRYEMYHDAGVKIFAEDIMATGSFWVEKGTFSVNIRQVTVEKGSIKTPGLALPITDLVAKNLWISDEKVATDDLVAYYEKAKVTGRGTVFIAEERYDLLATIDAPKATYPSGLKPLPFLVPAFNARIRMTGALTDPEFSADVAHNDTDFNGLKIKKGNILTRFNAHRVIVDEARLNIGEKGVLWGNGSINIDNETYQFSTRQKDISALELAKFMSFEKMIQGLIEAQSQLSGSFAEKTQNIHVITRGKIVDGLVEKITFAKETRFDVDINLIFDKEIKIKKVRLVDDLGLNLFFMGEGDLVKKSVALSFDVACKRLGRYFALPKKSDALNGLVAKGDLTFNNESLGLQGFAKIREVTLAYFHATEVSGNINLLKDRLSLTDVSAHAYAGMLDGQIIIDDFTKKNLLHGEAVIHQVELLPFTRQFDFLHIEGKLSSSLKIGGSFKKPELSFVSEIEGLVIDKARIEHGHFAGQFADNILKISPLFLLAKSGSFDAEELIFDLVTKKISGSIAVNKLNIGSILAGYSDRLDGDIGGEIQIGGTLVSPSITAPMIVKKLKAFGVNLGDGAVTLALARRPLLGEVTVEDLVFSISTNLNNQGSESVARFSVALNKKTINAEISFDDLELNTVDLGFFEHYFGLVGHVSGSFTALGLMESPILDGSFLVKDYGFFDPQAREEAANIKKWHGPATVFASSKNKRLDLDLCASFLEPSLNGTCSRDSSLSLSLSGPFSLDEFSFDVKSSFDYAHIEDIIFALKNELMTLDMAASLNGNLAKKKGEPISYKVDTHVSRLRASLPNVPNIDLRESLDFVISENGVRFNNDAILAFSPGQLIINGSYAPAAMSLHAQGTIPLTLSRLFIPLIQSADGLARGNITLSGSTGALIIDGNVTPEPGASLVLRKWLEPIEVKEGAIEFKRTSNKSFVTTFNKIKLAVGDGRFSVNGNFTKRYASGLAAGASTFNLKLQGSNIIIRDRLNFIESDFNIHTVQNEDGTSIARGEVIITDGSAYRQFDLRNFVAQAETSVKPGMFKALEAIDMQIALDIAVRQFRASARMLNLDIETNLGGHMTAEGPISHPKFKGTLDVNEGAIIFPYVSFDLGENQIRLDEHSQRIFDPKIDITATQVLENYQPDQPETVIELTLKGDIDRLNLGLNGTSGNRRLSQLETFMLLLSPRGFGGDKFNLKRGAQNVAMAVSGEVFLHPLTNELQELLEGKTKTRIQLGSALEPGGITLRLNWKLGPRVELQGSYMFLSDEARRLGNDTSSLFNDNYPLGDLKLKLLLFDHRPIGPLFLESSFASIRQSEHRYEPRGKIRLKYRVLAK